MGAARRQALILSGGGASAAFEVGVMKALFSGRASTVGGRPLEADVLSGTSMGAYHAAFLVSRSDRPSAEGFSELEKLWLDRIAESSRRCGNGIFRFRADPLDLLDPRCWLANPLEPLQRTAADGALLAAAAVAMGVNFVRAPGGVRERSLDYLDFSGLVSIQPMKRLVDETIDFDAVRRSRRTLRIAATNWTAGELEVFTNGDMTSEAGRPIVLAAAALPAIFPRVFLGGSHFHDGRVAMDAPFQPASQAGAEVLHVPLVDPQVKGIPGKQLENTLEIVGRTLALTFAAAVRRELAAARARNRQLRALCNARALSEELRGVLEELIGEQGRPLEIHVYRPEKEIVALFDPVDFRRRRIEHLIELGFTAGEDHDCRENGCLSLAEDLP